MSFVTKSLLAFAVTGGISALAMKLYRRPEIVVDKAAHAAMLLAGAREETCQVGSIAMHYYCAGRRGKPVILIHGLGGSAENWLFLLPRLSKEFLVYAPDMPGFGRTALAPEGTNIATHALYLQRFIDALGYPQVTLVGSSLGGWIATRFAVDHPERVWHLSLLNSAGLQREGARSPYTPDREAARRALRDWMGRPLPAPNFLLDAMVRNSQMPAYSGFIRNYDHGEELDTVLDQVKVPTTIIWGMEDRILPIQCAYDFHDGIANSELYLLPDIGHMPQIWAPAEVASIIKCAAEQGEAIIPTPTHMIGDTY